MAKQRNQPKPAPDPARAANQRILADRQERIDDKMKAIPDLGLGLQEPPETAAQFLNDAWDKAAFGAPAETISRWVYGPDPLIDTCPALLAAIEKEGLEAFAEATAAAILVKEHEAVQDPIMRRGLYAAIKKFGKEQVAEAFSKRILKIPARQVDYEIGDETFGDPLMLGSNALRDTVVRYGNEPGMSYKFLSQRCIDVLGMRGYVLVPDDRGEPAKAGTLFLARIPAVVAEGRRRKYAQESEQAVRDVEENYQVEQERAVRGAGARGAGSRPLERGEVVRANATESQDLLGSDIEMGVKFDRQA
jgi:hypothetical protein